ncbi:GntR family transcriptional regulator [Clostridioides sp. ZZV15-6388]|uniref:GntR family transcriptional regulator n=1 Tax=unclassified Clostridioides TaxID=2635829 RepID=UPI001D114F1E|nr:GntR family transcriptional regulator [Clostridioides sp. ZZV15-6388]MCC0664895.1 GntR family transcriptional regulator [Clostridioides sp. ZZV15-6597]
MKKKPQYLIIFQCLIQQIYTGKIVVGDKLGSIQKMSKEYMVSKNTIKTVIKMLSEEGFIETKAGARPVLIHNVSEKLVESELVYEKILQIADMYQVFSLIFPALAVYNIERFTSKDLQELYDIISYMEKNNSNHFIFREQKLKYINKLISKSNNLLIHSFCDIIQSNIMVSQITYSIDKLDDSSVDFFRDKYIEQIKQVYLYALNRNFTEFKQLLIYMYEKNREFTLEIVKKHISQEKARDDFSSMALKNCYLYDLIVSDIISQIFEGNLKTGDCLPSINSVISKYNISLPTVRSAYNELNECGIAKTINGKGTYITLFSEYTDDYIKTKEGAKRLKLLLDAMEFVTITLEDVVLLVGENIDSVMIENIEAHLRHLQKNSEECNIYPDFVLLCKIVDCSEIYIMQEIFMHLKQYIVFGIYIERFFPEKYPEILKTRFGICFEILMYLKKGDVKGFSVAFSNLFKKSFQQLKKCYVYIESIIEE